MDQSLQEAQNKIANAMEHLKKELSSIRAGRANPSLIEEVPVNVYGGRMKLMEVGTISAPQPSLLTVQVWDASIIEDVRKSILEANLGLNPSVDGTLIRLPIPPLTEERREEFVKMVHQKGETARVEVRQIRQDTRDSWSKLKEEGNIGEDEAIRRDKVLQDLVESSNSQIEDLVKGKEAELMQV